MSGVGNSLGTVWNSWQTTWVGEPSSVETEVQSTTAGSWSGDPAQVVNGKQVKKSLEKLQNHPRYKLEQVSLQVL